MEAECTSGLGSPRLPRHLKGCPVAVLGVLVPSGRHPGAASDLLLAATWLPAGEQPLEDLDCCCRRALEPCPERHGDRLGELGGSALIRGVQEGSSGPGNHEPDLERWGGGAGT
jgi:hypothetical protein